MASQVTLQAFTGNTFDTSASFILNINNDLYIFNIPETTQKMILSKNVKYESLKAAFITSLYPESVGGLSMFVIQGYHMIESLFSIVGPSQIPDVILYDPDYVKEETTQKHPINVLDTFSNEDLEVKQIKLQKSICYDVNLKILNQRMLVVDCRTIDDLRYLPDLSQYSVVAHLTIPEIFVQNEYIEFFASKLPVTNICFMPSGTISNSQSNEYYNIRRHKALQVLCYGKTMKQPEGFIDFTSYGSTYNFVTRKADVNQSVKYVDLNYTKLKNLNKYEIYSKLISFNPKLPSFQNYAITFLGSSTKFVSPERSNSGYLIHTKYGFIVLDPSEGFLQQVVRKYGPKTTTYILDNLVCVWLSHFHQDHCYGVPSLLHERSKVTNKPIHLCGPQKFIDDIKKISEIYGDFHLVCNNREVEGRDQNSVDDMNNIPSELKINDHLSMFSIDVYHDIMFAKGCIIVIDGQTKIAFSGDRAFQKDHFAEVFQNCDLLIHEATFPDSKKKNAKVMTIKGHCFQHEAVETVKLMNPKYAVFTHLSLRYPDFLLKIKPGQNILNAFDFLEFSDENIEFIFQRCGIQKKK